MGVRECPETLLITCERRCALLISRAFVKIPRTPASGYHGHVREIISHGWSLAAMAHWRSSWAFAGCLRLSRVFKGLTGAHGYSRDLSSFGRSLGLAGALSDVMDGARGHSRTLASFSGRSEALTGARNLRCGGGLVILEREKHQQQQHP